MKLEISRFVITIEISRTCSKKALIDSKHNIHTSFSEYVATSGPLLMSVTYF